MVLSLFRSIRSFFRSNFIAGLFIAVPFGITVAALIWVWGKINKPLAQIFDVAVSTEDFPWAGVGTAIEHSNYQNLLVPIVSLMLVLLSVLALGILTRSIIGRIALSGLEGVVARVPIVGMLYMSLKQLGEAFISKDGSSKFQRAVAVQFPYRNAWAIGFVTGKAAAFLPTVPKNPESPTELISVFVPTTPLPTAGFMIVVPEGETVPLNMTVQDALKLVVSGGIIGPGESRRHAAQPQQALGGVTRIMVRESGKLNLTPPADSDGAGI
jgi:uncharacterized membrane protein